VIRFLALALAFLLCGCAGVVRLTEDQAKQLAQADADAKAAALMADASASLDALRASAHRVLAACANLTLPPPETPPEAMVEPSGAPILASLAAEVTAAKAAADDPPSGLLGVIAGAAGGLGLAVLAALRFSPGAFGLVANLAHAFLAPKATRDMREAQARAQDVARQAIAYGHAVTTIAKDAGLGDQVHRVQATAGIVQDHLGIRPQVEVILAAVKAGAVPAIYTPPATTGGPTA
jgi:hypothetical protein